MLGNSLIANEWKLVMKTAPTGETQTQRERDLVLIMLITLNCLIQEVITPTGGVPCRK
jgi:hypothetical protein